MCSLKFMKLEFGGKPARFASCPGYRNSQGEERHDSVCCERRSRVRRAEFEHTNPCRWSRAGKTKGAMPLMIPFDFENPPRTPNQETADTVCRLRTGEHLVSRFLIRYNACPKCANKTFQPTKGNRNRPFGKSSQKPSAFFSTPHIRGFQPNRTQE